MSIHPSDGINITLSSLHLFVLLIPFLQRLVISIEYDTSLPWCCILVLVFWSNIQQFLIMAIY